MKALSLKIITTILCLCPAVMPVPPAFSYYQAKTPADENYDVFIPIGKYFSNGDAETLSAWFADNLEISIFEKTSSASKAQARQILKYFFSFHSPSSFAFTHKAEKGSMKYALGTFSASGEKLTVTFFVSQKGDAYQIQQLKIER